MNRVGSYPIQRSVHGLDRATFLHFIQFCLDMMFYANMTIAEHECYSPYMWLQIYVVCAGEITYILENVRVSIY